MKRLFAFLVLGLMLAGCGKDNPVDSAGSETLQSEAMFSETSMYNLTLAKTAGGIIVADSGKQTHDSLRNIRMLDSLKIYLSLTDDQFISLQGIGSVLFARLSEIRVMVESGTITRDSAKTLVTIAREEFVASVRLILTEDQNALFTTWIELYWNKPRHGGHGGGHCHGGHGGGHHRGGR